MLHEFVTDNRAEVISRCRALLADMPAPQPTQEELEHGVPLFLDQLAEALRLKLTNHADIAQSAVIHAKELRERGFTIAQVVRDYGGICQTITELAVEKETRITTEEFQTLNLCLDDAIAGAVTEFSRLRESDGTERLGHLAHEMRNALNTAFLAMSMLKSGRVGIGGSTGSLLDASLHTLRDIVDREVAEVRLGAGINNREKVVIREFLEEVEVGAVMAANARGIRFSITMPEQPVSVLADRQILASVVSNLLQNAFKFTAPRSRVSLDVSATETQVHFAIADECGGLLQGQIEKLFQPFSQSSVDRSGLGLGLVIARKGVAAIGGRLLAINKPGVGCVFTIDLPCALAAP